MIQIFFFSPSGYEPLKSIRSMLHGSHGCAVAGGVYGVATSANGVNPHRVVDALTEAGVIVFPSVHDTSHIPAGAVQALREFGITETDTAHDCAKKMHAHCGMPHLRPHRY